MAKDRKKLQHIHSSIPDKQPTSSSLEVGEIAVNNAEGKEFISLKNTTGKVVRISSDEQVVTWMEKKEVIPYSGTVDNIHLDTNRSNIEIKLNQVAAHNTVKNDVVNGASDIDGNLVNPSSDGGLTNGAGFAIDTSAFALNGGNPSFSTLTVTNKTTLSGVTNIYGPTNITGLTKIEGDINIIGKAYPTSGLSKTLSWTYGDVKSANNDSTNFKEDKSFVIPKCAGDINRATLDYKYGHSVTGLSDGNYDPGEACNNAASDTIYIPTSIDHLEEWNGNCFTIPHNLCVNGTVTASGPVYSTSDERKKQNIHFISPSEAARVRNIPLKSFNFKDDPNRTVYGVIAQEVLETGLVDLVHTDENGYYSVDYTSFLIMKIANLQNEVGELYDRIKKLENIINKDDEAVKD